MAKIHNFGIAAQFNDAYSGLSVRYPHLQPIARAFIRNMNRVRGIGVLPINLVSISVINETARMEAIANLKIAFHDNRLVIGHPRFESQLLAQVDQERTRLLHSWIGETGEDVLGTRMFGTAIRRTHAIIDDNESEAWEAAQATMAAMLIGLWTACESLAQDTWIAAVNISPVPLAQRVVTRKSGLGTGNQEKKVSWHYLSEIGFDLTSAMGDLLLRQHVVDFQSWKNIRAAYKVAFNDELDAIFQGADAELSGLEAVRNLFAHKAA